MKHLKFENDGELRDDEKVMSVYNAHSAFLGTIFYHKSWKRYVFEPIDAMFDCSWLQEIIDYMRSLK